MLTNDVTHFKHLSQFSTLKDFNNNIEMHLLDFKNHFTKKELIILKRLIRFSAKVYGVSNISIRRLIQAIEKYDNVKVSEATFHRMKRKAVKLGMLSIHTTKRTDNSQSSNIYVFNAYSTNNDIPCNEQENQQKASYQQSQNNKMTSHKADKHIKSSNILNTRKEVNNTLDYTHVSSNVPKKLVNAIKPFFNSANEIYSIYKRLQIATKHYSDSIVINIDDYVDVFKQTVYKFKEGHIRGDYLGYLYGAFKRTCDQIVMQKKAREGLYFNWLK